jgi:hypothetical protein
VEWITLLRIQEVPGSNLDPETGCPEVFCGVPQSLQKNAGIVSQNLTTTASFSVISNSSFTYHPSIQHYINLSHRKKPVNKLQTNKHETEYYYSVIIG